MPMSIRTDSTEFIKATFTADHDLTGVPIKIAVPEKGQAATTWYLTEVLGVDNSIAGKSTATYRIFMGPEGGAFTLAPGSYDWTVKAEDNPEKPVIKVETFTVTAN